MRGTRSRGPEAGQQAEAVASAGAGESRGRRRAVVHGVHGHPGLTQPRLFHSRARLLAGAAVLLLAIGVVVAVVDPFAGKASSGGGGVVDNTTPTRLQTVQRRSLTSQQPVSGTLGYARSWTVAIPAGTSATDLQQARQQEASARASYSATQAAASGDERTLATGKAALRAAQLKEASDCTGTNAATSPAAAAGSGGAPSNGSSGSTPGGGSGSGASACASSMQAVTANQATVATAQQKVGSDRAQLAGARTMLASAQQALTAAQAASSAYGSSASFTMLPAAGEVIRRGQPLYAINGSPTLLLYGSTPAWRSFAAGMSSGRDVAELNANLGALGTRAASGDSFTSATKQAIEALQQAHGLPTTGRLPLGSVAFEPDAVRVTTVTPSVGQAVQPGPIMALSSTRRAVSITLDASQQSQVTVGDSVLVTLPDNSTAPGVVSSVGKVATTPSSTQGDNGGSGGGNGPSTPTVEVDVRLLHPLAAGTLDQAPVDVLITTASVSNALVVPVNALVALAGGGYALEEVNANGTHQLVPVRPGLFDDQEGIVQISGSGVAAGQRVVVPAS